jgi:DNA-binding NtrC family response regulator
MAAHRERVPRTTFASSKPRVLAVDNDETFLKFLRRDLPSEWHLWTTQEAGIGLNWLEAGPFDLVIVDLGMRPMGGLYFLQEIWRIDPDVKTILTSVPPISEESLRSLSRKDCFVLVKPIHQGMITDKVRQTLFA